MENQEPNEQVIRHQPREKPIEPSTGDPSSHEKISAHIEKHIGPISYVLHEIVSEMIHVDIYVVLPTPKRPFTTLITQGMSDLPMTTPQGQESRAYAELVICLLPDWPLDEVSLRDERFYWPIRLVKTIARFPHEYKTWLFVKHTIPNGDPPKTYSPGTEMCCALITTARCVPKEFWELRVNEQKNIYFLGLVPLYRQEMEFKLTNGAPELIKKLNENKIAEFLYKKRKSVV